MRTVGILLVLLAHSSASFFGKFTGALSAVESSVGKLLSDVGHDLKETYDCTVDAVEEVIYDKDQIPKYYDKCKSSTSTESNSIALGKDASQPVTKQSVLSITDNKDIEKKLASVAKVVNNEYYRVDNMSSHLEHEFDGFTKNVYLKLKKIEDDEANLQKTLIEIEKLHMEEEMQIHETKDEIRQAFEEILKNINNSTKANDVKNEIKTILEDTEKKSSMKVLDEIEKRKEKEMEHLEDSKNVEKDTKQSSTESSIPRTFKELAAKILKENSTINFPNNESSYQEITKLNLQASSAASVAQSSTTHTIKVVFAETVTQASTMSTTLSSTEPVTRTSSTTATLNSIKSVTLSSKVPSTTVASRNSISCAISQASSTSNTLDSIESVVWSSTVPINIIASTKLVTQALSTLITVSSAEIVTPSSTAPTTTAVFAEPVRSTESVTRRSSVVPTSTAASTKLVTHALSTSSALSSTESIILSSTLPTTTVASTKLITEASGLITTVSATEPQMLTTITTISSTIEPVTQALTTTTTMKPLTRVPITTTVSSTIESTTSTSTTALKSKEHSKNPKRKLTHKYSAEKHHITKPTTRKPNDNQDGLVPKDPT